MPNLRVLRRGICCDRFLTIAAGLIGFQMPKGQLQQRAVSVQHLAATVKEVTENVIRFDPSMPLHVTQH